MRAPLGREVRRRRFLTRADHARVALAKSDQGLLCGAPPALPPGGSACRPRPGVGVREVPTKPRGQRVWCQEADGTAPIAR